mgnify:CR=1 FL=1
MSKKGFEKFINKEPKGAKKKEALRQEKKQYNREKRAFFDEQKRLKRLQQQQEGSVNGLPSREKKFEQRNESVDNRKSFEPKSHSGDSRKPHDRKEARPARDSNRTNDKFTNKKTTAQNDAPPQRENSRSETSYKAYRKKDSNTKYTDSKAGNKKEQWGKNDRQENKYSNERRPTYKQDFSKTHTDKSDDFDKPLKRRDSSRDHAPEKNVYQKNDRRTNASNQNDNENRRTDFERPIKREWKQKDSNNYPAEQGIQKKSSGKFASNSDTRKFADKKEKGEEKMPLNKYLAHAGVCARREAADIIKAGAVKVNNEVITEPGYKMQQGDLVTYKGKQLHTQRRLVYILLNKPKDYITTHKDPEGRKTVFELLRNATEERIYPVGRLDRNTTGVLLFTNDGELAQKLTHPSFQVRKIYEVKLDKVLGKEDFQALSKGLTLEDGFIQPDAVGYSDTKDKSKIGIEIHSGRNRIVRRMFEHLGYDVRGLDRVLFANLTKKNIERGHWRHLSEKEVRLVKYLNKRFVKKDK